MKKYFLLFVLVFTFAVLPSANAGEKIRIGVARFVSRADYVTPEMMPHITEVFKNVFSSYSDSIEIVLTAINADNAKNSGCNYVLLGALTDLEFIYTMLNKNLTKDEKKITFETRLIDVKSGELILSASGTGTGEMEYNPMAFSDSDAKKRNENMKKHFKDQEKMSDIAYSTAASMVSEKICAYLLDEYTEISSLKSASGNPKKSTAKKSSKKTAKNEKIIQGTVRINRGILNGVYPKTLYKIYFDGEEFHDINGKSLGREKFNVAIAEVKNAGENSSTAEIIAGNFSNLHEGDKAEQISREEAQLIIDKNDFARSRISEFLR